jgi:putative ABC transport system substrate-binding protein
VQAFNRRPSAHCDQPGKPPDASIQNDFQDYPKDLRALPGYPEPAVSWHSGFREGSPMLDLRRRQFITLIGGAAAVWPLAARAQQPAAPVIGMIRSGLSETEPGSRMIAFRQGLNESGYVEGQNVTIESRWAEGPQDRYSDLVADLIRRKVSVIATGANTPASLAAKAATSTIPIVFGVGQDPVRLGLVASLARPGGNATGVNFFIAELAAKRLGLLHEMVTGMARVAVLVNPANAASAESTVKDVQTAAPALGLQIQIFNASTSREIDAALTNLVRERIDALFVGPDPFFNSRRVHLAVLAARLAIPATYAGRDYGRSWRADELRKQPCRYVSSDRRLCWSHPQGREAGGPAVGGKGSPCEKKKGSLCEEES